MPNMPHVLGLNLWPKYQFKQVRSNYPLFGLNLGPKYKLSIKTVQNCCEGEVITMLVWIFQNCCEGEVIAMLVWIFQNCCEGEVITMLVWIFQNHQDTYHIPGSNFPFSSQIGFKIQICNNFVQNVVENVSLKPHTKTLTQKPIPN